MILIAVACLGAGIVIGVVSLTGVGLSLASVVISISGGKHHSGADSDNACLFAHGHGHTYYSGLCACGYFGGSCPARAWLQCTVIALFRILFWGDLNGHTAGESPVAAYAGAEVAGASMMRTGLIASRHASVAARVPFFFMYDPALLMQGDWPNILQVFVTATIGTT